MTVKELRKILEEYPDDMKVLTPGCVHYFPFERTDLNMKRAVKGERIWRESLSELAQRVLVIRQ